MAVTALPYGEFLLDLGKAEHDFTADTIKVALLTSSYTPDYATHTAYDDVSGTEVSGGGYTAGGITLDTVTWTYDSGTERTTLDADPITWAGLSATTRYAAVYKSTGTPSTSKLIGLIDFGTDRVYDAEPFQLTFTSGVVRITAI